MWKNVIELGIPQMTIWRMRIACWIPKATNIHSEHVIIVYFQQQQWWNESTLVLRHTYFASLVICHFTCESDSP